MSVSKDLIKDEFSLDEIKTFKIEMMCPNDDVAKSCLEIGQRNKDYDYVNSIAIKSFELYSKKNTKATGIIKVFEYYEILVY